jgi:hypothetical protein
MMELILLLERMMNDRTGSFNCEVKINKTNGGNLPNRKMFIRTVSRQTTLDDYIKIESEATVEHPLRLIYTIHPKFMRLEKLNDLVDALQKDLDIFLHEIR